MTRTGFRAVLVAGLSMAAACGRSTASPGPPQASGYVEATLVRLASKVGGRVDDVHVVEGARIKAGDPLVQVDTTDTDLALARVRAERDEAEASLRLLQAGSRPEDIAQAEAQVAAAGADRAAAAAELASARADEARFEHLLQAKAGSAKQRDDAVSRRETAEAKLSGAEDRARAAAATLGRLKAGARPQEIDAARARVAAADAQIATFNQARADASVRAPSAGVISTRLVEPGELVAPGTPLVVITDLDHAWATVYVEEPVVPTLRIGQHATVITDHGDRRSGQISFIASDAEFTPRNVQTATERAKLVYRVKVAVDNRDGVLKPGMPVQVEFGE